MCVSVRICERAGVKLCTRVMSHVQWNTNALNHHQQFKLQMEEFTVKGFDSMLLNIVFIIKGLVFI